MPLAITSPAFDHHGAIPAVYTCDGKDVSPPVAWSGTPPAAKSLALIVSDPDAPDPARPQRTWIHWVLYNLPASAGGLKQGESTHLPSGTKEGRNDWQRTGYGGPCPPVGRHRYFFRLYALDAELPELHQPDSKALEKAMQGHVVEKAELVGTYQR